VENLTNTLLRRAIHRRRSFSSYAKVRAFAGLLIRNRGFQLRRRRAQSLRYLDIGCGPNSHPEFVNLDYLWHPSIDVCWDISRGIPFASCSMRGIFSEHCLEHFPLATAVDILCECRRILVPGGILRIVVPDGELYLSTYSRQKEGDNSATFPYQANEAFRQLYSPILSVNRVFYQDRDSPHGHRFIYDFDFLDQLLRYCGFTHVTRRSFQDGLDPALLIDSESRAVESLYVEATVEISR
jgi:predicted SAM-dependent methyltransferase